MIQKFTKTIIKVQTNRAEKLSELIDAGWTEREVCLKFSDDQQAFTWNARIKTAVEQAHLKYKDEEGKVQYREWPDEMTPEMIETATQFALAYPDSFHRFATESGPGKGWMESAAKSAIMTELAGLKGKKKDERAAQFESERGFWPTVENIAAAMKRDFEAARGQY